MKIVYDIKLMRPACVLLQAAMGGDIHVANRFPAETWLIAPTDDMKLYQLEEWQLQKLIEMTKK